MKPSRLLFAAMIVLFSTQANGRILRVNNNPGVNAPYLNFTNAQIAATDFDTIYLEGSSVSYGNLFVTKPLIIIGTGYYLNLNPQTHASFVNTVVGNITFESGSSGSVIQGLTINDITIKTGNITIKRNYIRILGIDCSTSYGNLLITQNYFGLQNTTLTRLAGSGPGLIYNIIINNNIFNCEQSYANHLTLGSNCSGILSNNIFRLNVDVQNFNITNNIMTSGGLALNNNSYYNNIGNSTQFPLINNNLRNTDPVFIGGTSLDGLFQLSISSPAKNYGTDGTDCGAFGGITPYVLSGMPDIPAIYEITMPAIGNSADGINVTVKAKVHQ